MVTPAAPCAWIAQSTTKFSIAGAATLIIAISRRAALLPSAVHLVRGVQHQQARLVDHDAAVRDAFQPDRLLRDRLAEGDAAESRLQIISSSRSATPMLRMQ